MESRARKGLPVFAATLVWMWGCGDAVAYKTASPSASAPPCPNQSPSAGGPASGVPTTAQQATLSIRGLAHGSDGNPLFGVTVCLYRGFSFATDSAGAAALTLPEATQCIVSAADGSFVVLGAHAHDSVIVTFNKNGFAPLVRGITLQTSDITLRSDENELMPTPPVFMGSPADPSKGQIAFSVVACGTRTAADMSVTATAFGLLTGFGGPSEHPMYVDSNGAPAVGASSGTAGGFVNVPPGLYEVRFDGVSAMCDGYTGLYGVEATVSNASSPGVSVLVPVLKGYLSAPVVVSCANAP